MKKILLTEDYSLSFQLNESETTRGVKKLKGLFHLAEQKNANGRVYSKALLERELNKIMPSVKDRRILGELSHPAYAEINLERTAHVITELKMVGNKMYGELEVIRTPMGQILEALIDSGVKLGISSRGVGSLREEKGVRYVCEDYGLITWDVVANPSTPDAWLDGNKNIAKSVGISESLIEF